MLSHFLRQHFCCLNTGHAFLQIKHILLLQLPFAVNARKVALQKPVDHAKIISNLQKALVLFKEKRTGIHVTHLSVTNAPACKIAALQQFYKAEYKCASLLVS